MNWEGVYPAVTTPFREDLTVDLAFFAGHLDAMREAGCRGFVPLGSLGEGATLSPSEKEEVLREARRTLDGRSRARLVAGIAALSTAEAVATARMAERIGCDGLMVLPPYVYRPDRRETAAHFDAVIGATRLPCMLYNNPIAYGTDVSAEELAQLAERHANLEAVKESSGDVRRVTAIRAQLGDRLAVFMGVDDLIVEGAAAGAVGWIAGLVNALPRESVRLFEVAPVRRAVDTGGATNATLGGPLDAAKDAAARELYAWFLPLLRLDVVPKFVQLIKLVQQECGIGSERVRPPRLPLAGAERDEALALIRSCLSRRPKL
jgi:4-hydroxy-tetrahydrodipicolinate synthase